MLTESACLDLSWQEKGEIKPSLMVYALLKSQGGCPWKAVLDWQCPVPAVGSDSCRAEAATMTLNIDFRGEQWAWFGCATPPLPVKS